MAMRSDRTGGWMGGVGSEYGLSWRCLMLGEDVDANDDLFDMFQEARLVMLLGRARLCGHYRCHRPWRLTPLIPTIEPPSPPANNPIWHGRAKNQGSRGVKPPIRQPKTRPQKRPPTQ